MSVEGTRNVDLSSLDTTRKPNYGRNKQLGAKLKRYGRERKEALEAARRTDILLQEEPGFLEPENEMEKTYEITQKDLRENVDIGTAAKGFELKLKDYGPYSIDYSRNGRELLIVGKKGHVASIDWKKGQLNTELHLNETCHAIKALHNDQFFAVAQKKYTFIYDKLGTEIHRMKQHIEATSLEFLPYHFLLVTAGQTGVIKYQDVSTGTLVAELKTKMGPTLSMTQNPWNAVINCGHSNGAVTLWSPSMPTPLVKIQASIAPVRALAVNREGNYMAVASSDRTVKIWDIRTYKEVDTYITPIPATSLDISDTGLLSVGWGPHTTVWKNIFKKRQDHPYMTHQIRGSRVQSTKFVPFEDILGVGHASGFSSLIIPGAGEANFDAWEINPYESAQQRQQNEVRALINKLQPEMITLDPNVIGTVDTAVKQKSMLPDDDEEKDAEDKEPGDEEPKLDRYVPDKKGKQTALQRHMRKKTQNDLEERRLRTERNLKREQEINGRRDHGEELQNPALDRFK
ncbi:hypothetical protein LJB42_004592 [Komagataella kurtzmanii]|nr:hypothetical protein LJB42_004592 [Komagataella kurtzmanii]